MKFIKVKSISGSRNTVILNRVAWRSVDMCHFCRHGFCRHWHKNIRIENIYDIRYIANREPVSNKNQENVYSAAFRGISQPGAKNHELISRRAKTAISFFTTEKGLPTLTLRSSVQCSMLMSSHDPVSLKNLFSIRDDVVFHEKWIRK